MKPLLFGLIHQTILPFNDITMNINKGDKFGISFDNIPFKNYFLLITKVSFTNFSKISNNDIYDNGFMYKPIFVRYMEDFRHINIHDTIVKLNFKLVENNV